MDRAHDAFGTNMYAKDQQGRVIRTSFYPICHGRMYEYIIAGMLYTMFCVVLGSGQEPGSIIALASLHWLILVEFRARC